MDTANNILCLSEKAYARASGRFSVQNRNAGVSCSSVSDERGDCCVWLAKALDHVQPGAPGLAAFDFDRAGDQHLIVPAVTEVCRPQSAHS